MSDPIKTAPHKSSLGGLDANLMALLCYVAAFVIGLIPGIRYVAFLAPLALYFLEKGSRFVKFHAMQAFMLQLLYMLLNLILSLIGTAVLAGSATSLIMGSAVGLGTALGGGAIFGVLIGSVSLVAWVLAIVAAVKAYGYTEYEIPLLGGLARKLMGKF